MTKMPRWAGQNVGGRFESKGYTVRRFTSPPCAVGPLKDVEDKYLQVIRKCGFSIIKNDDLHITH